MVRARSIARYRRNRVPPCALKATTRRGPARSSRRDSRRSARSDALCAPGSARRRLRGSHQRIRQSGFLTAHFRLEVFVRRQRHRAGALAAYVRSQFSIDLSLAARLLGTNPVLAIVRIDGEQREIRDVEQPDALDPFTKIRRDRSPTIRPRPARACKGRPLRADARTRTAASP